MPKNISISKDNILNTALEIVREKGIDAVSNREIAKKLNCSIRPIYYQFKNSEELMMELNKVMIKYFYDFLTFYYVFSQFSFLLLILNLIINIVYFLVYP